MNNKTQFWPNPVNSLIFLIFYIYQTTWYALILHIVIFKI